MFWVSYVHVSLFSKIILNSLTNERKAEKLPEKNMLIDVISVWHNKAPLIKSNKIV